MSFSSPASSEPSVSSYRLPMNVQFQVPPGPRTIDWMALPATSPPSTRMFGLYTWVALTNLRKHRLDPCRSLTKYSSLPLAIGPGLGRVGFDQDHLDALAGDALHLDRIGAGIGDDGRDALDRHHRAQRDVAELGPVGQHDDPLGGVQRGPDDAGLLVVQVRDAPAHRDPGRADDRDVGVVALDALHRGRADAAELVLADHPAGHDHLDLPGAEQARDDQRLGDHQEAVARRGQPGELLHG